MPDLNLTRPYHTKAFSWWTESTSNIDDQQKEMGMNDEIEERCCLECRKYFDGTVYEEVCDECFAVFGPMPLHQYPSQQEELQNDPTERG